MLQELTKAAVYQYVGKLEPLAQDWAAEENPQEKKKKMTLLCMKMSEAIRKLAADNHDTEDCLFLSLCDVFDAEHKGTEYSPTRNMSFRSYFYQQYHFAYLHFIRKMKHIDDRSLDENPDTDEDTITVDRDTRLEDMATVSSEATLETKEAAQAFVVQMNSLITHFREHKPGKIANETNQMYDRLFYTADVTWMVKDSEDLRPAFARHERDTFEAMNCSFLDFYMAQRCRTVPKLAATPLKPYCETGLSHPDDYTETRLNGAGGTELERGYKLPQDVYLRYLQDMEGKNIQKNTLTVPHQRYVQDQKDLVSQIFGHKE